jgi:hypothetical protein
MRRPELIFLHSVSADGFDVPACDFQKLVALPKEVQIPYSQKIETVGRRGSYRFAA